MSVKHVKCRSSTDPLTLSAEWFSLKGAYTSTNMLVSSLMPEWSLEDLTVLTKITPHLCYTVSLFGECTCFVYTCLSFNHAHPLHSVRVICPSSSCGTRGKKKTSQSCALGLTLMLFTVLEAITHEIHNKAGCWVLFNNRVALKLSMSAVWGSRLGKTELKHSWSWKCFGWMFQEKWKLPI